jgi:hypothetical protein
MQNNNIELRPKTFKELEEKKEFINWVDKAKTKCPKFYEK